MPNSPTTAQARLPQTASGGQRDTAADKRAGPHGTEPGGPAAAGFRTPEGRHARRATVPNPPTTAQARLPGLPPAANETRSTSAPDRTVPTEPRRRPPTNASGPSMGGQAVAGRQTSRCAQLAHHGTDSAPGPPPAANGTQPTSAPDCTAPTRARRRNLPRTRRPRGWQVVLRRPVAGRPESATPAGRSAQLAYRGTGSAPPDRLRRPTGRSYRRARRAVGCGGGHGDSATGEPATNRAPGHVGMRSRALLDSDTTGRHARANVAGQRWRAGYGCKRRLAVPSRHPVRVSDGPSELSTARVSGGVSRMRRLTPLTAPGTHAGGVAGEGSEGGPSRPGVGPAHRERHQGPPDGR